jgi:antitoxin YefM
MNLLTVQEAQGRLQQLVNEIADSHQPVLISGDHNQAVMVSQADWNAIQETLYLVSIPGMKESIQEAAGEPIENCTSLEDLDW